MPKFHRNRRFITVSDFKKSLQCIIQEKGEESVGNNEKSKTKCRSSKVFQRWDRVTKGIRMSPPNFSRLQDHRLGRRTAIKSRKESGNTWIPPRRNPCPTGILRRRFDPLSFRRLSFGRERIQPPRRDTPSRSNPPS